MCALIVTLPGYICIVSLSVIESICVAECTVYRNTVSLRYFETALK